MSQAKKKKKLEENYKDIGRNDISEKGNLSAKVWDHSGSLKRNLNKKFKLNKNESKIYTNFGDTTKGVLKVNVKHWILIFKTEENSQVTNLSFYFKKLKKSKLKPKQPE